MNGLSKWTWHMLAGLGLVVFLGIHMITMHLDLILGWFNPAGGESLNWANVTARGKQAIMPFFYVTFLGLALYHGLYGLRTIIFELGIPKRMTRLTTILLLIAGISLFGLGSFAAFRFASIAASTGAMQ